jgi:hypothetical protein
MKPTGEWVDAEGKSFCEPLGIWLPIHKWSACVEWMRENLKWEVIDNDYVKYWIPTDPVGLSALEATLRMIYQGDL